MINIAKINWSFIKALNIKNTFKETQTDAQMHNIHIVAPTSPCNCAKLELCTTPNPELSLDRWMEKDSPFLSLKHISLTQCLGQYKYTT